MVPNLTNQTKLDAIIWILENVCKILSLESDQRCFD